MASDCPLGRRRQNPLNQILSRRVKGGDLCPAHRPRSGPRQPQARCSGRDRQSTSQHQRPPRHHRPRSFCTGKIWRRRCVGRPSTQHRAEAVICETPIRAAHSSSDCPAALIARRHASISADHSTRRRSPECSGPKKSSPDPGCLRGKSRVGRRTCTLTSRFSPPRVALQSRPKSRGCPRSDLRALGLVAAQQMADPEALERIILQHPRCLPTT